MKSALFRALKISEFGRWFELHNGGHVIHVTSDDVTGAQRSNATPRKQAPEFERDKKFKKYKEYWPLAYEHGPRD